MPQEPDWANDGREPSLPDDYFQPDARSERHRVADAMAVAICAVGLNRPYGGKVELADDRRCREIAFSLPRLLDGKVRVYNAEYISVWWRTSVKGMPSEERRLYSSSEEAMAFLQLAFVDGQPEQALAVPVRMPRPRKAKPTPEPVDPQAHLSPAFVDDFFSAERTEEDHQN